MLEIISILPVSRKSSQQMYEVIYEKDYKEFCFIGKEKEILSSLNLSRQQFEIILRESLKNQS